MSANDHSLLLGDCIERMREIPDASVASVVTDPPYGLGFMGKKWDALPPGREWAEECLRVLKPGGHLLAFGGTRTYHRLAVAVEDAGFEVRDCIFWLYGSGFPKSKNLDGERQGWGTALRPACEPIIIARRALSDTVAATVTEHGTGALNIDGCRIGTSKDVPSSPRRAAQGAAYGDLSKAEGDTSGFDANTGRWPANVALDEEAAALLDAQTGKLHSQDPATRNSTSPRSGVIGFADGGSRNYADSGGASRFFYVAKATQAERNEGLTLPSLWTADAPEKNDHPTVKPIALLRWLVRLATPAGGIVLDPFLGSGTTAIAAALEGFPWIGIERDPDYMRIAEARISFWDSQPIEATA